MKLSCNVARDLLPLYHDGVCSDESRALVKGHLEGCPDCTAMLKELRGEIKVPHEAPDDGAVLKKLEKKVGRGKKRAWVRGAAAALVAVLTTALVLGAGYQITAYQKWTKDQAVFQQYIQGKNDARLIYRHQASESPWDNIADFYRWTDGGFRFHVFLEDPGNGASRIYVMPTDNNALDEDGDSRYIYLSLIPDKNGEMLWQVNISKPVLLIEEAFQINWFWNIDTNRLERVNLVEQNSVHSHMLNAYKEQIYALVEASLEQWPFLTEE